jgi:hypothetical protein
MAELTVHAPAKINLHLEVLGLRPDGFHELAMVMQTLDLVDTLTMRPTADGRIDLHCDAPDLPTDADNLIVRAAERLRSHVGLPELGARIALSKRIPIGAGLAGGSSDGAAALVGLNALWGLGLTADQLHAVAAGLGHDRIDQRTRAGELRLSERTADRAGWPRPVQHVDVDRAPLPGQVVGQPGCHDPGPLSRPGESGGRRPEQPRQQAVEAVPCQPHDRAAAAAGHRRRSHDQFIC